MEILQANAVRSERDRIIELERRVTRQRDDANSEISVTTTICLRGDSQSNSIGVARESSVTSF